MASVIDADTHVIESAGMWELIDKEMYHRRPVLVKVPGDTLYGSFNAFWLIDGNIFPKPGGKGSFPLHTPSAADREQARRDIELGCRELTDPEARLRDMDKRGVETQVIYPTLFLVYLTDDVALEIALCRAYNRWMAAACARGHGRLRWVVIPPLRSIEESIREIRFGKEHGAVGVFFRGVERDRSLADRYFFPIYEEASHLNLPICIHTGAGSPAITSAFDWQMSSSLPQVRLLPLIAFRDLVGHRIPEQFPTLRFGFIEAAASWVPFLLHVLRRQVKSTIKMGGPGLRLEAGRGAGPKLFRDYRLFVACEADEDLPMLLNYIDEDHLLIGSDYGHQDPSEEAQLVATMRSREDIPSRVVEKMLCENARRFYPL